MSLAYYNHKDMKLDINMPNNIYLLHTKNQNHHVKQLQCVALNIISEYSSTPLSTYVDK